MKKIVSAVLTACLILTLALTGCGKSSGSGTLKLEKGILTWDAVEKASFYEVDLGDGGKSTKKTTYDLASACNQEGDFKVTVRYVDEKGERKDIGSMDISTSSLAKPIISVQGDKKEPYFCWRPVEDAISYSYDAHDGKGVQVAEKTAEGDYKVPITDLKKQIIQVTANGTSKDNKVLLSSKSTYTYTNGRVFDMSLLSQYTAVYTGDGNTQDLFRVGSTLDKGVYELELSLFLMDSNGNQLSGNGIWGRRIFDQKSKYVWFCEKDVEGFEGSGNSIPNPDEVYRFTMELTVDRGGNILIPVLDFSIGDRIVVADITYGGKSVLNAEGGKANQVEEVEKFDISTLDNYLATFKSPGGYYTDESAKDFQVEVPVNLSDGTHTVQVIYYVCAADGDMLSGNGMWGRRIAGADIGGPFIWLNEYDINEDYKAVEIPKPTQSVTSKFTVNVQNGKFTLLALDFNKDEMLIISDVKTATVPSGNGVFVSEGNVSEIFKVSTTLEGLPRRTDVTLRVTYKVHDIFGSRVSGNGVWGRRIDSGGKLFWLCENAVTDHPEAQGTIPDPNQEITQELFFDEINKYGVITMDMYDFDAGDVVEITSIQYNGVEVLKR